MKRVGQIFRESLVNHIKKDVQGRGSTFLVSYTRVSGPKMNTIRKTLQALGAEFYASRNQMAQRALKDLSLEPLSQEIQGQTAFVFSNADTVEISKTLVKFTKEYEGLVIRGGFVKGTILGKKDIERLSDLPSKKVLFAMLLGTLQSPATRLASVLNGKTRELLSILKQFSEKGGK